MGKWLYTFCSYKQMQSNLPILVSDENRNCTLSTTMTKSNTCNKFINHNDQEQYM